MKSKSAICFLFASLFALLAAVSSAQENRSQLSIQDYARAEKFLPWNITKLCRNLHVDPHWLGKTSRFWFREETPEGKQFVLVDPAHNLRQPAFDHAKLASALSTAVKKSYEAGKLPFETFEFVQNDQAIQFAMDKTRWTCNLFSYHCDSAPAPGKASPMQVESPDKQWAAYVKNHNLYVRSLSSKQDIQLTTDGRQDDDYALDPDADTYIVTHRIHHDVPLDVVWSPDSSKFITYKLDQTKVALSYLLQSVPPGPLGSARPILHSFRFPFAGDANVAVAKFFVFDLTSKSWTVPLSIPEQPITFYTPLGYHQMWWDEDGRHIYYVEKDRWWKTLKLYVTDVRTNQSHVVLQESSPTRIESNPEFGSVALVRALHHGAEFIWYSERDGWNHFYLYDGKTGALKNQITSGSWDVRDIQYVDEPNRWLYFTASGREPGEDPYLRHLYRIHLDGSGLQLLTPENADHQITFSPDDRFFVDTFSRVDTVPVSLLRSSDGTQVQELGRANIDALTVAGWKSPEPFHAKADDGVTDIYGVIFRPSNFDPSKKYPVIDSIYPGPQIIRSAKSFADPVEDHNQAQAVAELGFVVITVDGRGTPYRSKAFHNYSYGKIGDAGGLEDHVAAIKQLAARYPYLDIDRMGIYGHSGGGFASVRAMLAYPDFYKVAVSSSGDHDLRGYLAEWGETYEGPVKGDNYLEASNPTLALTHKIKGKLLLVWGDMDDNVPPSLSLQLVSALIKTNSDFDTLVLPNRNHTLSRDPYFIRRRWDYFVQNLLNAEPPRNYQITLSDPTYKSLDVPEKENK